MTGRPAATEAAPYYFTYIDQVPGDDPLRVMDARRRVRVPPTTSGVL